ncbi:DUF1833 family protein [Halomonas sp. DN3]|uniref:DUF1833 family protein n=1 Tax=Halomonas sp. DN3 TaxID=2953657 RepID=UPI0020A0587C|nr:DUF1833 family protein [Halomonas sp. DN3]USZ48140.1 DUF1833 domain-containing protein [Halomonas sp. DN3]
MAVRSISADTMRELFAQNSGAMMLACVQFTHAQMSEPARIVNNTENIQFNGQTYIGLPFELTLPSDTEERIPTVEMRVDNVDRTLVDLLRSVDSPPGVRLDIVRVQGGAVTPEIGPLDFVLLNSDIGVDVVTLSIGYAMDILNEPAVAEIFNPGLAPGLF